MQDRTRLKRPWIAASIAACMTTFGCVRNVRNDIDSTNSELTGPYTIRRIVEGRTWVADVCVGKRSRTDLIASQLVHQQFSRGHDSIIVNLYREDGERAEQATWTPANGTQLRPAADTSANPCR